MDVEKELIKLDMGCMVLCIIVMLIILLTRYSLDVTEQEKTFVVKTTKNK